MIELDQSIKTNFVKGILTDNYVQRLTIVPNKELRIVITIPHNLFESFVDVFDAQDGKVYMNWVDHYGDTDNNLKSEMKDSIEKFIQTITRYPLRVIAHRTAEQSTLEVYRDEMWTNDIY